MVKKPAMERARRRRKRRRRTRGQSMLRGSKTTLRSECLVAGALVSGSRQTLQPFQFHNNLRRDRSQSEKSKSILMTTIDIESQTQK